MRVWRICKAEHVATAFTGEGAVLYPGRWHHPGTSVVYCSESRAQSAIVPGEHNFLLNPRHPDFGRLAIGAPEPFAFDESLVGPGPSGQRT